jgi:hypothetical protein
MEKDNQAPHDKLAWRDKLCGAKARQNNHKPCRLPAMKNGRCRLHGGWSTGPKTEAGKLKAARANYKHGHYTTEAKLERMWMKSMMQWRKDLGDEIT